MNCSLLITYLFISLLFFSNNSNCSTNLIHKTCKKAAKNDPNICYKLCVASLGANPKSRKASLEELGAISFELAISHARNTSSCIKKLLKKKDKSFGPFVKSCLEDCSSLYSEAIITLKNSLNDYRSTDYYEANFGLSSAMDASTTCEDGFNEKKGEVSPLTKANDCLFQLCAIALAFTTGERIHHPSITDILKDCSDQYSHCCGELVDSMEAFVSGKYGGVNAWLSSAMTYTTPCQDCFGDSRSLSIDKRECQSQPVNWYCTVHCQFAYYLTFTFCVVVLISLVLTSIIGVARIWIWI